MTNKEKAEVIREVLVEIAKEHPFEQFVGSFVHTVFSRVLNELDPPDERIGRRCKIWNGNKEPMQIYRTGVVTRIDESKSHPFVIESAEGMHIQHARLLTDEDLEQF